MVYYNGIARFSGGWNSFARDKKVKKNETLLFNLMEGEGGLVFDIVFPRRSRVLFTLLEERTCWNSTKRIGRD